MSRKTCSPANDPFGRPGIVNIADPKGLIKEGVVKSDLPNQLNNSQGNGNLNLAKNSTKYTDSKNKLNSEIKISDIIGDFGPYQIAVILFAALRAMSCAMDGLSGPFISPNVKNFQCEVCVNQQAFNNRSKCSIYLGSMETLYEIDRSQCFFNNPESSRLDTITCNKWSFDNPENLRLMHSLTVEHNLVCDREWLKSLSNSMYFVGATFGLLFWGIISDRYGRKTAYVISHFVTLIFGFWALFADSMCTYIILRSINAFGMIGELIPRSIQVEMVATRYRFVCSVICQIGWATGIISVPLLSYINPSYRFILAFPVLVSALMLPWLIWLPESARWLITNNNYPRAKEELKRAARINGKTTSDIDSKIDCYYKQVLHEETGGISPNRKRIGIWRSILAIFTNLHLLKDTVSVFTLLFVAEVVYFSLTLNVADLGGSLYLNYIISGLSELVSIACCAIMLAYLSRRTCLSMLLLASTLSYLLMALVNIYESSLSMTLILAVNAFGKLTAIGNLMVIILVSQEVFPTVIRQFGTSLCITVGKLGSAVAPFTHELGQIIGQSYCFAMFSIICLACAIIPFALSETGNCELPDTVIDMENGSKRRKGKVDRRASKQPPDSDRYVAHFETQYSHPNQQPQNETTESVNHDNEKYAGHKGVNIGQQGLKFANGITMIPDTINFKSQPSFEDLNNNYIEVDESDQTGLVDNNQQHHIIAIGKQSSSISNLSCDNTFETLSNEGSSSDISSIKNDNNTG